MNDGAPGDIRERVARLVAADAPMPEGRFDGRGIVICAGGARIFTSAYVLISVLRQTVGCKLPIEVWHFGAEEMSPAMAGLLAAFDVDLIDATPLIKARGARVLDGWQLKPFALQWSRFAEVLMLDADQVPTIDPTGLFDWPEYRRTGAVFWPDIADLVAENQIWATVGLPPERVKSLESGQLLIDKRRHWRALSLVVGLNEEADALYRFIYGDKDTFFIAWRLAGEAFALVPHSPFADDRLLVQRDFAGEPLFQHRTNAKWNYAGDQYSIPKFIHEAACLTALSTLRAHWGGRVYAPPARSLAARQVEIDLLRGGLLTLIIPAENAVAIELLPHGEIGRGRSFDRRNWFVDDDRDGHAVIFSDGDMVTYRLHPAGPRRWAGRRLSFPSVEAEVVADERGVADGEGDESIGLLGDMLRAAGFPASDPNADAALADALLLLDGIEPGVARRLERLAGERSGEPAVARRLLGLAARVGAADRRDRRPDIGPGFFSMGYAFSHGQTD